MAAAAGPDFAAMEARSKALLAERVSALPEDQQAWMAGRTFAGTENPVFEYHKKSTDALLAEIDSINDIELLRTITAVEVHRSDVAGQRDKVILRALIRIRDLEPDDGPDEDDIEHVMANTGNKPMLDDAGAPIVTDSQDVIASNEAAGRVPPDKPWNTYGMAGEEKLIAKISEIHNVDMLNSAVPYEAFYDNRPRVLEALHLRITALTAKVA